jgi:RimJ/RimL family protein N-acetyltransferase
MRVGGLVLRPPQDRDLEAVEAACADPEIARFIPFVPAPYSRADAESWLQMVEQEWHEGDGRTFAIVDDKRDPSFQGVVTVRLREGGGVGYWLAPWARGRGAMAASVRAVVEWAQTEHGVKRLSLRTHPANVASQRVAERAGFKRVGITVHEPPYRDGETTAVLFQIG